MLKRVYSKQNHTSKITEKEAGDPPTTEVTGLRARLIMNITPVPDLHLHKEKKPGTVSGLYNISLFDVRQIQKISLLSLLP